MRIATSKRNDNAGHCEQARNILADATLVSYATLEELMERIYDCPLAEIESVHGVDEHGQSYEISPQAELAHITAMGLYGFADAPGNVVHYWCAEEIVTHPWAMDFVAHELMHLLLCAITLPKNRSLRTEVLCNLAGAVATQAAVWFKEETPNE
jgi:hypothetical protein